MPLSSSGKGPGSPAVELVVSCWERQAEVRGAWLPLLAACRCWQLRLARCRLCCGRKVERAQG
jgi:hypothetical protein